MTSYQETKLRRAVLELQRIKLIERHKRQKMRDGFIRKHQKQIRSLSMEGWPRTKHMKDYIKWMDLVYKAKISGVYSIGTSNCDVIAQLNRFAKQLKPNT